MVRKEGNGQHKKKAFHLEFKNVSQKLAWTAFEQNDILFLLGPAGVGKSFLAVAFAITELLAKKKERIILTRPIVEAGEKLGFLPGSFEEKVDPYMLPLYDCIGKLVGFDGPEREKVNNRVEVAPIAYLRGRTFCDSVCIFDEAQNATYAQLLLFLTRMGEGTKLIITGDPKQSDLPGMVALVEVVQRLKTEPNIGIIEFTNASIVRHPLVGRIIDLLAK